MSTPAEWSGSPSGPDPDGAVELSDEEFASYLRAAKGDSPNVDPAKFGEQGADRTLAVDMDELAEIAADELSGHGYGAMLPWSYLDEPDRDGARAAVRAVLNRLGEIR